MSIDKLKILGKEIKKGTKTILEVDVAKLHTRNSLRIPVIIERALLDGPILLLIGGVHGDESNGVAIVRDIIRKKYNKPISGTVICIPVFNVFGYLNLTREFPDGKDLNRVFPGSATGSLASQFAFKFTKEIAPFVDYVIDYHTGGSERENYPNVRCNFSNEETLNLAKVFNAPYIVNSSYIAKSIRETLNNMGKTVLVFEGGKTLELNQEVIKYGVDGALNVMKYLKMQEGELDIEKNHIVLSETKWIRAPYSGIFEPLIKNGVKIKKKSVIGRISDPYGEFERKIISPFNCHVFCLNTAPIVNRGDALFHVSEED